MDDETGKPLRPGNQTIQIDALPDAADLYASAFEDDGEEVEGGPAVSLPPPLPPRMPGASSPPGASHPRTAAAPNRRKLVIAAILVAVTMAGLGLLVGQLMSPAPPPQPTMDIGPIEVQ